MDLVVGSEDQATAWLSDLNDSICSKKGITGAVGVSFGSA
jgi:hypothetical protein